MSVINQYLNELARCEMSSFDDSKSVEAHIYNGIDGMRGRDYYFGYLSKQNEQVLNEIQDLVVNENKEKLTAVLSMIYNRLNVVVKTIEDFEVPSDDTLDLMQKDYQRSGNNIAMKNELDRMKFFSEMAAVQMYYATQFKLFLDSILYPTTLTSTVHIDVAEGMSSPQLYPESSPETSTKAIQESPTDKKYVYGLKGLREILDCGQSKAQSIVNGGTLWEATSKVGRTYSFDVAKVREKYKLGDPKKSKKR